MVVDVWVTGKDETLEYKAFLNEFVSLNNNNDNLENYMGGDSSIKSLGNLISDNNLDIFIDKILFKIKKEILKIVKDG